ncbi:MAG: AAA family ATPase [Holophagaceae bacterium]|uniref:AAA family ATPase n=1 Tax=Candidatus Geothrix odensensis TaxID=2954440 RepID=A0A936F060_9BACT|nr:AAA family ATPase [Candidatus Geothrix odensensis]
MQPVRWSEMRHQSIEPVEYEIEEISPKVPFGLVAAQGGHGKSILTVQMAVGKATGLPVLGFSTFSPGGVCIVALEDDQKVVHRRITAAVRSYGADFTEEHHRLLDANLRLLVRPRNQYASMAPELLDMALAGLAGEIEEAMKTCEAPPALCYLDTLNSVHEGDENDAKETRPLVAAILGLNARLGCSVWVVHHLRKISNGSLKFTDRMDPELVRGSSAIVNSSRATLQFGWVISGEARKAGLDPDRCTRRFAVVGITKLNDGGVNRKATQHTQNAGLWRLVANGSEILHDILQSKGKGTKGKSAADMVLDVLSQLKKFQTFDKDQLAERAYPNSKDPKAALRQLMGRLRKNGLIHPEKDELTAAGKAKVSGNAQSSTCDEEA